MKKDERDLLEVLKFELEFVEKGGYGRSPRDRWRAPLIFEDSPACMNYDSKNNPEPCGECALMQLVPPEFRDERIPCRHIAFNAAGETLDSLYRHADDREIGEKYMAWLRNTIELLESRTAAPLTPVGEPSADMSQAQALHETLHPKCANPACPAAFHWLSGGRFFRFRPAEGSLESSVASQPAPAKGRGVKHYWLCQHCSETCTLAHDAERGVIIKLRWQELPAAEHVSAT